MTSIVLNYMSGKVTSYFLYRAERFIVDLLDFKNHSIDPPTCLCEHENAYDFQVFFMPNDNENLEREIELLPKTSSEDSWEFID